MSFARITALEPPRRIAWESTDHRVFRTHWEILLEPHNENTRVSQAVTFEPLNPFAWVILQFRKRQVPLENLKSLAQVKRLLEKTQRSA